MSAVSSFRKDPILGVSSQKQEKSTIVSLDRVLRLRTSERIFCCRFLRTGLVQRETPPPLTAVVETATGAFGQRIKRPTEALRPASRSLAKPKWRGFALSSQTPKIRTGYRNRYGAGWRFSKRDNSLLVGCGVDTVGQYGSWWCVMGGGFRLEENDQQGISTVEIMGPFYTATWRRSGGYVSATG